MTIVEIKDFDFAFNGETVLEDVNLTVRLKDFMAIIGPNGGGKTTIMVSGVVFLISLVVEKIRVAGQK